MRGFRLKPTLQAMDFAVILPKDIEYICTTQVLDKIICSRKGIDWNQEIADKLEEDVKHYFVVKKNYDYNVVSSVILDEYLERNTITLPMAKSDKAKKCIEHYIKALR